MIRVIIENENNELHTGLPRPMDYLAAELGSIGITKPISEITLEKDSPYKIRLSSDKVFGQAVLERIAPYDNLAELNRLCCQIYKGHDDTFKAEIINESNANCI